MQYLNDMARIALYSHIASGDGGTVLLAAAGRWEAMQIRAEIRTTFLANTYDKDEMFDLDAGGCRIVIYFGGELWGAPFPTTGMTFKMYKMVLLVGMGLTPRLASHLTSVGSIDSVIDCGG